jgi:D-aminopeptidase
VGAEVGATHRPSTLAAESWEARIRSAILEELQDVHEFNLAQLSISIEVVEEADDRQRIEVSAQYPFHSLVDWPALPQTVQLHSSSVFEQYR